MSMFLPTKKILSLSGIALMTALSAFPVQAQSLPPAPSNNPQDVNQQYQPEPPGRVARVGYAYGNISFADAGSNVWTSLQPNRPLSTGDSIMVPELGKAELQVGADSLRINANTRLSFVNLDDNNIQINLSLGSVVFRVRALQQRENIEINTPNLRFVIQEPGEYRINVNDYDSDMVGYQQLDEYGNWDTHVEYGAIWYPRGVSVGWAPYRDGHWVWVSPWGWTWVDRSPWGFAPYHYGRWTYVGHRWRSIPGRWEPHYHAVYAPALVAFVGFNRGGVHVGISVGNDRYQDFGPSVSWFPLGPGEVYRPYYHYSDHYLHNVNQNIVINNTTIIQNNNYHYHNQDVRDAVTSVPTQTFVRGEHVFPHSTSVTQAQIKQMHVQENLNLQPEKNNRFGDERPRYWQDSEKNLRHPVVNAPERQERSGNVVIGTGNNQAVTNNAAINAGTPNTSLPSNNRERASRFNDNDREAPYNNPRQPGRRIEGNRIDGSINERVLPAQTATMPATVPQPQSVNNGTGIRTIEEMNQRPVNSARNADESSRGSFNQNRFEDKRDTGVRRAAMEEQTPRQVERKLETNNDRAFDSSNRFERRVERMERNEERSSNRAFERSNERVQERTPERVEDRGDRSGGRFFERVQNREAAPMPKAEPRVTPPEPKRENPPSSSKSERDKNSERKGIER
ncbi:MAG: hypothetical protein HY253_01035 [Burkholderiales bacterium]|nr:hypothetical protein [Burkholderiales bacterium]